MRQIGTILLTGAAISTVAASIPRGVGPEFAQYYTNDKFTCIGYPDIVLRADQINDRSCDCPDGSDEPGTSACANLDRLSPPQPLPHAKTGSTNTTNALPGFWCENKGHVGTYVPFSYVNDGVCDYDLCCDGSDEYLHVGGVQCENRCAALGKEARRVEAERQKRFDRAANRKKFLADEARKLRAQVHDRVRDLRDEIADLENKRNRLQIALTETERAERGKVVKGPKKSGKLGVLVGVARQRVDELRDILGQVVDHRDDLQDKVDTLEDILRQLKTQYNPNFNDEGVKSAVHAWEDYIAKATDENAKKPAVAEVDVDAVLKEDNEEHGVNWKEFEAADEATEVDLIYGLEAYLPPSLRDFIHESRTALRTWLVENGILADNSDPNSESPAVRKAREAFQNADNDVASRSNTLRETEADLEKDYGQDDVFRALRDQCISTNVGEYEYELCWLGQASQKSRKGSHGSTSLGRFERVDVAVADEEDRPDHKSLGKGPRMVLRYENGQSCWNGPNRRTDVWLGCAETEEIWRVTEAEKCVYKMEVGAPIACDEAAVEKEARAAAKDEL